MNLILNLTNIRTIDDLRKYALKIDSDNIITKMISQISLEKVENVLLIVNQPYKIEIENLLSEFNNDEMFEYKEIGTEEEAQLARALCLNDVGRSFSAFKAAVNDDFFGESLNPEYGTVLIDGSKLYKKSIFNFDDCTESTIVTFTTNEGEVSDTFMWFYPSFTLSERSDIKKVIVSDYKYNFIDMTMIQTLIQSSQSFSENKKLRYAYILELFSKYKFDEALEQIKFFSRTDEHWIMLYLEFLEGFGYEAEFIDCYFKNKYFINSLQFTITQKKMYEHTYKLFDALESEQVLVNNDIKDYMEYGNTDFSYVLNSVMRSKTKQMNLSYLINGMIQRNSLEERFALDILEFIDNLDVNPYMKMKNIVDIVNYFTTPEQINKISHVLLNVLFAKLHENQELFEPGLLNIKEKISSVLKITTKGSINHEKISGIEKVPVPSGKVAVCITGLAKYNYQKNLELMEYFLSDLDADYFIQMWNVYEEFPALADFGKTNDKNWAKNYMSRIKKFQPAFIERQANFEALLPRTSKLLFTKKLSKLSKNDYTTVFSNNVKSIKLYDYSKFADRSNVADELYELNKKSIKYFERFKVSQCLEETILAQNSSYEYVINIDVNTMLKSKVRYEELKKIKPDEVHVLNSEKNKLGIGMTVSDLKTSLKMNNLWQLILNTNTLTPYSIDNILVNDKNQDTMLMHLLDTKINWLEIKNNFGEPYINKKIKLPLMSESVKLDVKNLDGDNQAIIKYFEEADKLFTKDPKNNIRYQNLHCAKLIDFAITEKGISVDISITGNDLTKILKDNLYLSGNSEVIIDSDTAKPRIYKEKIQYLKFDDQELVVRKEILEKDLYIGRTWLFSIMYHDYTLTNINIEYDEEFKKAMELNKHGLKYIDFNEKLRVGIATKSFILREMMD